MAPVLNQKMDTQSPCLDVICGDIAEGYSFSAVQARKKINDPAHMREKLAIFMPVLEEQNFAEAIASKGQKVALEADVFEAEALASEFEQVIGDMVNTSSDEERETKLANFLRDKLHLGQDEVKKRVNVFREVFQVCGIDAIDLNGFILAEGVNGLKEEHRKMVEIQKGIDDMKHLTERVNFAGQGTMAKRSAWAAMAGGIAGGVMGLACGIIGAKKGTSLGPGGSVAGFAAGFAAGSALAGGIAAGLTMHITRNRKDDVGMDPNNAAELSRRQMGLTNAGTLVTNQMNNLMTTQVVRPGQNISESTSLVSGFMEIMARVNSVRSR